MHRVKNLKIKLGGLNKFVEIDKSLVFKVKYNKGSALGIKQIWIFGLVERGKYFITVVPNRKASTLFMMFCKK